MNAYQVAIVVAGATLVLLIVLVSAIAPALRRFAVALTALRAETAREAATVSASLAEIRRRALSRGGGRQHRRRTSSRGGDRQHRRPTLSRGGGMRLRGHAERTSRGAEAAAAGAPAAVPGPDPISPERA